MRSWRVLLILVALMVAAGCNRESGGDVGVSTSTTGASVGEGAVTVKDIAYNPKEVHTPVGKEIVWTFDDNGLEHTVVADDGSFDSGRKASGEFKRAFDKPGTIAYHCNIHARMHGTIVVS